MERNRKTNGPAGQAGWRSCALLALLLAACSGDDDDGPATPDAAPGDVDGGVDERLYAVGSIVSGTDSATGYVSILRTLDQEEVPLDDAYEFPGAADVWVHAGAVFVSGGESPTVTRFRVTDDGTLEEEATVSFADYGIVDTAFWNNTFISDTKAYMLNDVAEYVIWNPKTMEITGTLDIPELEPRESLIPRAASTDRGNLVSDGRLYQPMYWTDQGYADRADDSQILVFDVEKDELVEVLDAPCPGLDVGTAGDDGNLYFSNWTGGVGTHLVLDTAPNCVARVATDSLYVSVAVAFADVAEGREGAVFHHVGGSRFLFSVFHQERVDLEGAEDPFGILAGPNWKLWSLDVETGAAAPMDSVEWNSGAVYWFDVDGAPHALIPADDYGSSTAYDVDGSADSAARLFHVDGYGIRLFRIR